MVRNQHDYSAYVGHWNWIMEGNDPWIDTDNAYGIVYSFFAPVGYLWAKLPKLIFIGSYLFAGHMLLQLSELSDKKKFILSTALLLNPLFLVFGVVYGSNDLFMTGLVLIAVVQHLKNHSKISGLLLASAAWFKFTAAFLGPFFAIQNAKINWKFILSFIGSSAIILLCGFLLWGDSFLIPFEFGSERPSKMLSLFRFIRGELQPLSFAGINNLDHLSMPLMLFSWVGISFFTLVKRMDWIKSSILALSSILLFYKVGHHQFFILLFCLYLIYFIKNPKAWNQDALFRISFILFWSWIFLMTILYAIDQYHGVFEPIREFIGAPTFMLLLLLSTAFIRLRKLN